MGEAVSSMKLEDKDILGIFNTLQEQNHPDPVGFLARSELISGLENSFSENDKLGVSGLRVAEADRLGEPSEEVSDNLSTAVKLDLENFSKFEDVSNMHVAFLEGDEAVQDRSKRPKSFLRRLNKAKKKWDARLKKIEKNVTPEVVDETPKRKRRAVVPPSVPVAPVEGVQAVEPEAQAEPTLGDASKLAEIKGAFSKLKIERAEMPKRGKSEAQRMLRDTIRRALANA